MKIDEEFSLEHLTGLSVSDVTLPRMWDTIVKIADKLIAIESSSAIAKPSREHERDLTLKDLAYELNKSYSTIWRMVRKRKLIPADNSSRTLRFRRKDVDNFKKQVTW